MTPEQNIQDELKAISELVANLPRLNLYGLPEGYFEQFAARMLALVQARQGKRESEQTQSAGEELKHLSPLLAGLSKKSPFSIPDGYFDQVGEEIRSGVAALQQANEVLEEASPLLLSARNLVTYKVPAGYFDNLPAILLKKIKSGKGRESITKAGRKEIGNATAKVISMSQRWFKYAAAAVIAGIVVISAWWYQSGNHLQTANNVAAAQLQTEINKLSDNAILEFLESTQTVYSGNAVASNDDLSEPAFRYLLNDVSDEALQQYLADQPERNL